MPRFLIVMLVAACLPMPIGMSIGLGCLVAFQFMTNGASVIGVTDSVLVSGFIYKSLSVTDSRLLIMLILNILLIIIGMFVNTNSAIVLFGPIMVTIASAVGVNALAFGVIMVTNLCIGMVTPPVGSCFYISQKLSHSSFDKMLKELIPPVALLYVVVITLSCFPQLITFLPDFFK